VVQKINFPNCKAHSFSWATLRRRVKCAGVGLFTFLIFQSSAWAEENSTGVILEPDHAYIWVSEGAPEASKLRDIGLLQWPEPADVGEGVAWTGFQFENFFLELTWVYDPDRFHEAWLSWHVAHSERAEWKTSGAAPFALAFKRRDPANFTIPEVFEVDDWWDEYGGYVRDAGSDVPFLMLMGPRFSMPNPSWMTPELKNLSNHPVGIRKLTSMTVRAPGSVTHRVLDMLVEQDALTVVPDSEYVLELTFDEAKQCETFDGRPELPLIIHY
jgi:hypothetical protein